MPSLRAKLVMSEDFFNTNQNEESTVSSSNRVVSNIVNILPCVYQLAYLTETSTIKFFTFN